MLERIHQIYLGNARFASMPKSLPVTPSSIRPVKRSPERESARGSKGTFSTARRQPPQSHQKDATLSVILEFAKADRATIVSACGTGKTLIGAEVFGELGDDSRYTIVFAPTLALIAQTIKTWRNQYPQRTKNCLIVCSDSSVIEDEDEGAVHADMSDLLCVVTTSVDETREALDHATGDLVVFCTYSSAPVVAEALPADFEFHLGVFDEAHRTAGDPDRRFAIALTNREIPIAKRLFMTATERLVRSNQIGGQYVYSMDDERVYGRVVFRLTLGEAIARGLVCDYRIVLGCVGNAARIPGHWLDLPPMDVPREQTTTAELAALVALYDAFENLNITRAITFHDRVASALAFRDLTNHLPAPTAIAAITAHHVNGTMSVRARDAAMDAFRVARRSIVTNARCLAEGVDAPEVEMVALMSRRSNPLEVTQMCGRALRLSPRTGKTHGYIFVPIYLSQDHEAGVDLQLAGADFTGVLEAIFAMAGYDETLQQVLLYGSRGNQRAREALWSKISVLAPPEIAEKLRLSITTNVLSARSRVDPWSASYAVLAEFHKARGHCRIPRSLMSPMGVSISNWLRAQRQLMKSPDYAAAHADRVRLLTQIDALTSRFIPFENSVSAYVTWRAEGSPKPVPKALKHWIMGIRAQIRANNLSPERERRLTEVGFDCSRRPVGNLDAKLRQFLADLHKFRQSCLERGLDTKNISRKHPDGDRIHRARVVIVQAWKDGLLTDVQTAALRENGIEQSNTTDKWMTKFDMLSESVKGGHDFTFPPGSELGDFVVRCRVSRQQGKLSAKLIALLDSIGFPWSRPGKATIHDMIARYKRYREETGRSYVSAPYKNKVFLAWATTIRKKHEAGTLKDGYRRLLDAAGFAFTAPHATRATIHTMLEIFERYKKQTGTSWVCRPCDDAHFLKWAIRMRYTYANGTLNKEHQRLLEAAGFAFTTPADKRGRVKFPTMLARFEQYRKRTGNPWVGRACGDDHLCQWANRQRSAYSSGTLDKEHQRLLQKAGFAFTKPAETPAPPPVRRAARAQRQTGPARIVGAR